MANITLKLKKKLFVPKFYPMLFDYSHRWEVYMGSAGSAKSYFITQKLIVRACNEPIRILVCRNTGATIRDTSFSLFKEILTKWKLYPNHVKIRETDFNIKFDNGSEIIFKGLDKETKLLSLNNISVIFIEEAYEVPKNIVEQLNLRLRGQAQNKQIIMAFNPISKQSWIYDFCEVNPPKNFIYLHSTFEDNPFLDDEYLSELREMEIRNPEKYRVFGRGEWGVDSEGLVIKNWRKEEFDHLELAKTLEHRSGLDFGFTDPSAIIDLLYDKKNHKLYVFNEFYRRGCQYSDLAKAVENMGLKKSKIYADHAEPRGIENLRSKGVNIVPCVKGQDSVKAGIMFLQDHTIIVHPRCTKFIMELENFSYIKNNKTGEWTDNMTHEFSHAIDACRYALSDVYMNKQIKTLNKAVLGL